MTRWFGLVFAVCPWIASACDATPSQQLQLAGVWQQRGYARIYAIEGEDVTAYDVTAVSCVLSESSSLSELMMAHDRIERAEASFSWYERGRFTRYDFDRLAVLPPACSTPPEAGPVATFEALWHLFAENYAFFAERNVDWQATYEAHRARVDAHVDAPALMGVFQEMLEPLNDGHVYVFDGVSEGFLSGSFGTLWEHWAASYTGEPVVDPANPRGVFIEQMQVHVERDILAGAGASGLFGALHWGMLEPGIGYLDVHTMNPRAEQELDGEEILAQVDAEMGRALDDLADAQVLIVDLRFNEGGQDAMGYAIAGHFVRDAVLVSRKYAVHGAGTTESQPVYVVPRGARSFEGPIVLLQGPNSVSAAETFAIALHALPQVRSVGEATYGALSDTLVRVLPNGWVVSLSNETYEAHDGTIYEARGVPPEIEVAYDASIAFEDNLRRALDEALNVARLSKT